MSGHKWKTAHKLIDMAATAVETGYVPMLHSNETINKIASAAMSPLAVVGGIRKDQGITNTLERVYGGISNPNVSNIAGSAFTVGVGMGAAHGLTHDSAGNPDIAGIPFI